MLDDWLLGSTQLWVPQQGVCPSLICICGLMHKILYFTGMFCALYLYTRTESHKVGPPANLDCFSNALFSREIHIRHTTDYISLIMHCPGKLIYKACRLILNLHFKFMCSSSCNSQLLFHYVNKHIWLTLTSCPIKRKTYISN